MDFHVFFSFVSAIREYYQQFYDDVVKLSSLKRRWRAKIYAQVHKTNMHITPGSYYPDNINAFKCESDAQIYSIDLFLYC